MPDGPTHAAASILVAWSPWVIWMANNVRPILPAVTLDVTVGVSIGALSGIFLSPDLDLEQRTLGKGILYRSSCLVGAVWSTLWWPYSRVVYHRSLLSHGPIIGTLLRLAYLVGLPLLVWTLLAWLTHAPVPSLHPVVWWIEHQGRYYVIGLALSDCMHWAMDSVF